MKIVAQLLTMTLLPMSFATAQLDPAQQIERLAPMVDRAYQAFAEQYHSPGLAYAVVFNGEVIHWGSLGHTDVERQVPVTDKSVFRIASMTKSFVAAAIVKLRDEGKLQLDDPVEKYIPNFKGHRMVTKDAPTITIRHLLTHTSGLPEDDPWGDRLLGMDEGTFEKLVDDGFSFSNTPGVSYEYSNTPFALLGVIIKVVSGLPYHTYVQQHILEPLGMGDTYFEYRDVPADRLAKGYRWVNNEWVEQPLYGNGVYGAMGGMLTTLGDFAKYMQLHQQAWPARDDADNQPLRRASLREMQAPWVFNTLTPYDGDLTSFAYGYGLRWTRDVNQITTVGHTGGLPGFGSNWMILPDYGLGLVCFSNVTYAPAADINTAVAKAIVQQAGLKPRALPVAPILKQRQDDLVRFLPDWENAEGADCFSGNFFPDNYVSMLRADCDSVFAVAGAVEAVHDVVPINNLRGTFVIRCENRDVEIFFSLTPESTPRIQQFAIRLLDERSPTP